MENEQIYDEESFISDESSVESVLSSIESGHSLEDKLDRVEALLNEEISLRENEQLTTESGSVSPVPDTSSGVNAPNYDQYIYDLLTDSTIKVEVVQTEDISNKPLANYSVMESLLLLALVFFVGYMFSNWVDKYIFKFRRR